MKKTYRFKTKEEFIADGLWNIDKNIPEEGYPEYWNNQGKMNCYLGQEIPKKYHKAVERNQIFYMDGWEFKKNQYLI